MKILKKAIAAVLSAVLIASIGIFSCFADTYFEYAHYTYAKNSDDTITIAGYDNSDSNAVIPQEILGHTVVAVGSRAFYKNKVVTSVTLPDTVTAVKDFAFGYMPNLVSANVPKNCNKISMGMFDNCTSLTDVTISEGVTEIADQMFNGCTSLKEIVLPSTVTQIGDFAFSACTSLEAVTILDGVTSISDNAFQNSPNVTIYGYEGSYARQYAEQKNIPFVALKRLMIGDVDQSGDITIDDVTEIQLYLALLLIYDDSFTLVSDANGDGVTNIYDATEVQRYLAMYNTELVGTYISN